MPGLAIGLILFFLLTLISCGSRQDQQKVQNQVAAIKTQAASVIESLPTLPSIRKKVHQVTTMSDPFQQPRKLFSKNGNQADRSVKKQPLEAYTLNSLKMVGTIKKNGQYWALILAPDGNIYAITIGQYIGQQSGQVTAISIDKIKIDEKFVTKSERKRREIQLLLRQS